VFPTFLHAAGAPELVPAGHFQPEDGQSLLCLLTDPSGTSAGPCAGSPNNRSSPIWRTWLDMEHSTVYNASKW
jgi:hypothetical protein